jgi:predicted nuclease with RNAse H fold
LTRWAGVDVGGVRKGFDVAVVDMERLVARPRRFPSSDSVVAFLGEHQPRVVAVDSPRCTAPEGSRSRACERLLATKVCGIRYTPDQAALDGNAYYDWIVRGLELYAALEPARWQVIECFPTASWTRWLGPKGVNRSRAAWTRAGLGNLGLAEIPPRTNQDVRDAIAAALTARLFDEGQTERFGEIVVAGAGSLSA